MIYDMNINEKNVKDENTLKRVNELFKKIRNVMI